MRPINFIFRNAGWGHGVGMCQVGADVQASQGRRCETILRHYYPNTSVNQIYATPVKKTGEKKKGKGKK